LYESTAPKTVGVELAWLNSYPTQTMLKQPFGF